MGKKNEKGWTSVAGVSPSLPTRQPKEKAPDSFVPGYDSETAKTFSVDKYGTDIKGPQMRAPIGPYVDGSDALANRQQMVISFQNEATGHATFFKAFITALNETFNSDWVSEHVFGRVDPIKIFRSTERQITLTFKVPAASQSEAYDNLGKIQSLIQYLYPTYASMDGQAAQMLGQSPLVRLKVMNLVQRNEAAKEESGDKTLYDSYATDLTPGNGLLGVINNVQINHNLESNEASTIQTAPNTILPTYIDVSIDFSPIHEHAVGWNEEGDPLTATFPYGISPGLTAADRAKIDAIVAAHAGPDVDTQKLNDCLAASSGTEADIEKCKTEAYMPGAMMAGVENSGNEGATIWDYIEGGPSEKVRADQLGDWGIVHRSRTAVEAGLLGSAATPTPYRLDVPDPASRPEIPLLSSLLWDIDWE